MRTATGSLLRRRLLLCVLSLAVVGMHHVAFASACSEPCRPHDVFHVASTSTPTAPSAADSAVHSPAGSYVNPAPVPEPEPGHDLLHLCLAILAAMAGVLLVWLLLALGAPPAVSARRTFAHTPRLRRRRAAGRSILTSLCVLRI
jgi:hypothetical protein